MFGLTPLGLAHTAISLVALAAGIAALVRFGEIPARHTLGRTYIWATVLTCLTGFGIFRHGGFGAPHRLPATLVTLAEWPQEEEEPPPAAEPPHWPPPVSSWAKPQPPWAWQPLEPRQVW